MLCWQGQRGSNPRPAVLETAALPTELYPYRRPYCPNAFSVQEVVCLHSPKTSLFSRTFQRAAFVCSRAWGVFKDTAFFRRCAAFAVEVFETDALAIRRAISGTALAAAPFARRTFGTVSRRRGLRHPRNHENDQQAKKHSRHCPSPFSPLTLQAQKTGRCIQRPA